MIFHCFGEGNPSMKKRTIFQIIPNLFLEKKENTLLITYISYTYRRKKNRAKNVKN